MRSTPETTDELVRARLAYVSVGHAPLGGPRRAVGSDEPDEEGSSSADDGPAESTPPPPSLLARLELTRRHLIAAAILVACGVVLALMAILRTQATEVELLEPVPIEQTTVPSPPPTPEPVPTMRVHVLGGVTEPGVVTVDEGAIVADAIAAAGGFTSDARPGELNLAAAVTDGMQVLVGVEGQESAVTDAGPPAGQADGGSVNLNTASQAQLEELPGVGPVTATAIIDWRERNGGFSTVSQLQEVDGIGPKTFAKLEPLVTT